MPLYRINKSHFPIINWRAVKQHVHSKMEFLEAEISALRDVPGLSVAINPDDVLRNDKTIVCQFWIDPDDYKRKHFHRLRRCRSYDCPCQRKIVGNPRRFNYLNRGERDILFKLFRSVRKPWINLRGIWVKQESGLVTVYFKVNDYEPFLLEN